MLKHFIKKLLPRGKARRRVLTGVYRSLSLEIDLDREMTVWFGLYERETYAAVRTLSRGCRSALDLGAGNGELSLHLLRLPEIERIVAVEPRKDALTALRTNLLHNATPSRQRALVCWHGYAGTKGPAPAKSLVELCDGLRAPTFIKIDVDGPEFEILAEAENFLASHDCRLLVETHSRTAEDSSVQLLCRLGYVVEIIGPAWWRRWLPERRPIPHNRWFTAQRPQ